MDIATKLTDLQTDLRNCRQAITEKGGEISATAGFAEVAEKILDISTGSNIGTVTDDTTSAIKQVPINSVSHCFVKSIGGMTYKCNNLIPFPYVRKKVVMDVGYTKTISGVTFTVLEGGGVKVVGTNTSTGFIYFDICEIFFGHTYSSYSYTDCSYNDKNGITSVYVATGTTVDKVFYPMLNAGTTALPYEPYFEGLRDNKVTAIKSYGAQLIPFPYYNEIGNGVTKNGITVTVNADRSITVNGTATALVNLFYVARMPISAGTYTFSIDGINAFASVLSLRHKDTGNMYSNIASVNDTVSSRTFTVTEEEAQAYDAYMNIYIYSGTTVNNVTIKPMLNRGSVAVPYTPYRDPITFPIPEAVQGTGKGVEGASDTTDFEMGEEITNCTTVVFDGTEPWDYRADYNCVIMTRTLSKVGKGSAYIITSAPMYIEFSNSSNNRFSFGKRTDAIENYGITSAEDWQNYLAERYASGNPVTVTYAIAEPTEESLSVGFGLLPVEGGGSLEIITDNGGLVPTSILYQTIL